MAEQYTPGDGPVRYQYVVNRMREGATRTHAEQEYTRWLAAHDARVRRDAALHEKQRIAGEVRLWASINDDLGYTESAETLTRAANDIDRIPEETP